VNLLSRLFALSSRLDGLIEFDDGRPRNGDGQFEPQGPGNDFDPATMRAAYGPLPNQKPSAASEPGSGAAADPAALLAKRLKQTGFGAA